MSGGRRRTREQDTARDYVAANITLQKGLCGAKPEGFCYWLLQVFNVQPGDTLDDIFPGTGIMGECFRTYVAQVQGRLSFASVL